MISNCCNPLYQESVLLFFRFQRANVRFLDGVAVSLLGGSSQDL